MRVHTLRSYRPLPGSRSCGDRYELSWTGTAVMGVLNVTPDSFSDGGRYLAVDRAVERGTKLVAAGALFVDVGGESTRPGSKPVEVAEELGRVLPVIERLAAEVPAILSIDTRNPQTARAALAAGAHLVNDIGGLRNPEMLNVCAEAGVPAVLMHMQGQPETMQVEPHYDDVVGEVAAFLEEQVRRAQKAGVPDVIVDPGLGFGKTLEHNRQLLLHAGSLAGERKLLIGASRKGMIARVAGPGPADRRDAGSIALHLHAASRGAAIVRVHDVAGHVQALRMWEWLHE